MNTTSIAYLALTFDLPLHPADIPAFRGSFARLAGRDGRHDLFHNHNNDSAQRGDYHHRYPLVQYRTRGPHAMVLGLGRGADALADLHATGHLNRFSIRGHRIPLRVIDAHREAPGGLAMHPSEMAFGYRLERYLPFSQARYEEWQSQAALKDKIALLERLLRNHLVSFCYAVDWPPPTTPRIAVQVTDIVRRHTCRVLGKQPYLGFTLDFRSNLHLPAGIALGRKTAFGYGVLQKL